MFSSRLPGRLAPNAIARALAQRRQSGAPILDLTETNPTAVGLRYPDDILAPLADARGMEYRPHPLGLEEARQAVAAACPRPLDIGPDQVVLTSSTSEAYSFLFKLLCDPGDRILVPQPSYPLFDVLTGLEGVRAAPYRLIAQDGWAIDRDSVTRMIGPDLRAILVVSPNNPTGSILRSSDREWLVAFAVEHDLSVISDEVFADYPLSPHADAASLVGESRVLTFALGGLSKSAGLPQAKLAWIVATGPAERLTHALERLEVIADAYLSVSTAVQIAAPRLMQSGRHVRERIATRLIDNLTVLRTHARSSPSLTLFEPEGGWSAVLRIPATAPEEDVVLRLLNEACVLVHPGYFFDFADEAFLVLSLLPKPEVFKEGVARLVDLVASGRS
jgi:aspartate/methionine/tyrosine aminotransferase